MRGQSVRRKTVKLFAAGVAGMGLAHAGTAQGALVVDLRALEAPGGTISSDGKHVLPSYPFGSVTLGIFARVTGANTVQESGEFGGDPFDAIPDTRNDDSVQIVTGSIASTPGGLLGNFSIPTRSVPFDGPLSSNGLLNDIDGDGDLDVGVLGSDPAGMFVARSGNRTYAVHTGEGTMLPSVSSIIDASTSEVLLGRVTWTVNPASSGLTQFSFIPRPDPGQGAATWFEDGGIDAKNPGNGIFVAGAPVTVPFLPEPSSLGLLVLVGGTVLRRRRGK